MGNISLRVDNTILLQADKGLTCSIRQLVFREVNKRSLKQKDVMSVSRLQMPKSIQKTS